MVQSAATKRSLSPARRRLIEWMQNLNFGRVEGLQVREGEPVVECPPRIVREIKFGGEFGPRPEVHKADFLLKAQVRDAAGHANVSITSGYLHVAVDDEKVGKLFG